MESAVTRGYDGKGVFYVWSAGNGHNDGDNSNLNGIANFYAVTAAVRRQRDRHKERVLRDGRQPLGVRTLKPSGHRGDAIAAR